MSEKVLPSLPGSAMLVQKMGSVFLFKQEGHNLKHLKQTKASSPSELLQCTVCSFHLVVAWPFSYERMIPV